MTAVDSIDILRQNLEFAKEQLKSVDNDIKRITGRDPSDDKFTRRPTDANPRRVTGRANVRGPIMRNLFTDAAVQERQKGADEDLQVSLASSVVCVADTRSRLEAAKVLQKSDRDRGRRMLGILQNTLTQFKAESAAATTKPQMAKRLQIDAKLEARAEKEKEQIRRERAQLFRSRREQQIEISILQQKMRLAKTFEAWKTETEKMIGFCRTNTKPHIFFRPRKHNEESKIRVAETEKTIHDIIRHRQRKMDLGLEESVSLRRRRFAALGDRSRLDDSHGDEDNDADDYPLRVKRNRSRERSSTPDAARRSITHTNDNDSANFNSSKSQKPRLPSSVAKNSSIVTDSGDMSDASETFAIEGDEEPVLMEEEHISSTAQSAVSPSRDISKSKNKVVDKDIPESKLDTRTVSMPSSHTSL